MTEVRIHAFTAMLAGSLLTCAAPAQAQDALGGGNALDSNLGIGTGGINTPATVPNYRDRNLLITGDVIGGRGFRGSVGYTAEGDFRGRLGSNDLFNFRSAAEISSPQLFRMGSTYDQFRFGQDLGLIEYRRAGSAAPASIRAQDPISLRTDSDARLQIDRRVLSTSLSSVEQQIAEPRIIGSAYSEDGQSLLFNASTVRGITVEPASQHLGFVGLSSYDGARIREDVIASGKPPALGYPFETRFDQLLSDAAKLDVQAESQRIDSSSQSDYQKILQRVVDRYADSTAADITVEPELLGRLDQQYQSLRDQLIGKADRKPETARPFGMQDKTDPDLNIPSTFGLETTDQPPGSVKREDGDIPLDHRLGISTRPGTVDTKREERPSALPTAADYEAILRHGQRIDKLSGPTRDRFNELLQLAEQKLREGDYFLAERRFERATRFIPSHPMATAGIAHSQIGAGLYLSASLTLRNLLSRQPELIDATYSPNLLPAPDRMAAAVTTIQNRLSDEFEQDKSAFAFLLAYIGRQMGDVGLVKQGLDVMSEHDPLNPLLPLVRELWLTPTTPAALPQDAPSPDATTEPADPEK